MKIIYSKSGKPIADHMAEEVILEHYQQNKDLVYCNEFVLYAVRVLALRGTIDRNDLDFYYEYENLGKLNEHCQLSSYPFIGVDEYLDELLGI